jgi:hypothetical protein
MNGGPLAYESEKEPEPLSLEEEAALAFAGCGVTGPTLAELPYENGDKKEAGSGNIIIRFLGRTVASAEAVHATTLFVMGRREPGCSNARRTIHGPGSLTSFGWPAKGGSQNSTRWPG